jgi:phosphatidylglycerophosphate synthase
MRATDATSRQRAEDALFARLGRSGDGWFTRTVDRRFSRAITHALLPTGIAPNVVTIVAGAIGVAGGLLFASGWAVAGALLFLLSTILDGCDGEIARLTHRESPFGARLDLIGDNVVHVVLFSGIAIGLYRAAPTTRVAALGVALVVGVFVAMAAVYWCLYLRTPTTRQRQLFEAFASREFAYLLVVLALVDRLEWFLWASAIGTYVFAGILVVLADKPRVR